MNSWQPWLNAQLQEPYMIELREFIKKERSEKSIYPQPDNLFNAFKLTPYEKTRVVILGQDPYHSRFTAHGLAFSSLQAGRPPSLKNIFIEVNNDYFKGEQDIVCFKSNNLTEWASQGVLLINTVLTVEEGRAGSHRGMGWEKFTENVFKRLNLHERPLVFMLWGTDAQGYGKFINPKKHLVLKAAHPQAENHRSNAGFFGCQHFTRANDFLAKNSKGVRLDINWGIWQDYK